MSTETLREEQDSVVLRNVPGCGFKSRYALCTMYSIESYVFVESYEGNRKP